VLFVSVLEAVSRANASALARRMIRVDKSLEDEYERAVMIED